MTDKTYRPKRWIDMRKLGWFSGDDHVHGQILSDDDAARLMAWLVAEDVHLGNIVKMGDITRTYFEQRGFGKDYRVINSDYVLSPGQECPRTHQFIGHTISMNINSMVRDTNKYYLYDYVADTVHGQGGLWGYAHVNSGMFHVHRDMSVNVPKGKCDFAEVLQFGHLGTELWYQFLDLGFKVTASCGSDVPWGGTIGEVRLYACIGEKAFDPDAWFEAVRRGRTFVTNGPMIEFTVNDALPGDEIVVKDNAKLHVRVKAMGQTEFSQPESVKVVKFGQEVRVAKPAKEGDTEIVLEFDMEAGHGCWLAAVTRATNGCHAHTTPIYVRREGLRWWKFEDVDQLLDKRLDSLSQIEKLVADAKSKDLVTLEGDQELKQLALQGDELLKRVDAARKIYEQLRETAVKEKAIRGSNK
ncbi:MAG TPA: CehA/McbA family metallohydrolase [Phycisphaerae bacterium]|nr:CehA/McbA family metallohydrolase [Phycisphaerae bacterium]HRR85154.1 CehA/McbA family metallohydrolase [Phycisphaerae bacterium]